MTAGSFFKATVADGFVKGVGEHAEFRADGWNVAAFIEHGLGGGDQFGGELVSLAGWSGAKKSGGSLGAEFFAGAFYGDERYSEGAGDLAL